MNNDKSIDVINTLIEINNDRIAGYETALKETEENDLKTLFSKLIQTSQKCKTELVDKISQLGGTPTEGTKTTGKIYRAWMDVKSALTGRDRKAILNSCEYGEDVAVDTYKKAIKDNSQDLSPELKNMLDAQFALIKGDHDKVRNLRNSLVESN